LLTAHAPERFACALLTTTRGPKPGDDGEYRYITTAEYDVLERDNVFVATTRIPSTTEDRRYGYDRRDLETMWRSGQVPVAIAEPDLLTQFIAALGRSSVLSIGLLPPGESREAQIALLADRLRKRGRETEEQLADRLKNAAVDLRFFDEHPSLFDVPVVNDDLSLALEHIRTVVHF
jgi:guanylate kinase